MEPNQFEVWIADLNPTIGTEPGKVRPVIVVQSNLLNKHHLSSIICPITSKVQLKSKILRIHLPKGSCGLNEPCDIMIDQVRAIDNKRLIRKIGIAPKTIVNQVHRSLKIILDLE
jgi:mRNA interferase MazF